MAKRILVLDGHPDPDKARFCHAVADSYAEGVRAGGHDVRLIRLAETEVPILRSQREWESGTPEPAIRSGQDAVGWAEHIVLIYPLWLGTMPALLKAYLEQVLRPDFAIGPNFKKLLKGRSARVVITMGMPAFLYRWYFLAHSLRSLERNILGLCGIGPIRRTLIGGIGTAGPEKRARWLDTMKDLGRRGR